MVAGYQGLASKIFEHTHTNNNGEKRLIVMRHSTRILYYGNPIQNTQQNVLSFSFQ